MSERLRQAMRDGGVTAPDARGLMPLAEARARLAGETAFDKGEGRDVAGAGWVLGSDELWAALLSLADADEFVAIATRLEWRFHPRGFDNIDLYLRYSEGIVPWLETRLVDGTLVNQPWCVGPCLLACASAAAFALVWRVERTDGISARRAFVVEWLDAHAEAGAALLAARAQQGDARALGLLAAMWARGQAAQVAEAARAIGDAGGALAWASGGDWAAAAMLALLDAFAARRASPELALWPSSVGDKARRCHGLRVVAARQPGRWGVAVLRLEGERPRGVYPARVALHAFGSHVVGDKVRGARVTSLPIEVAAAPDHPPDFARWLAARVTDGAIWPPLGVVTRALALDAGAEVVAVHDAPAHVDGPARAGETPAPRHQLPSASPLYQALAAALARDAGGAGR